MNRNLKIALAVVIVLAVAGGAYAFYLVGTPTKAPSQPVAAPNGQNPPPALPEASENIPVPMMATGTESIFRIDAQASKAEFTLNEVLRGEPKTVVGTTNNVSGEIAVDPEHTDQARIGTIRINARTFKTDSEQRNRAIVRMIFKSEDDANEFIEFTPTQIVGVPTSTKAGEEFAFIVTGDLTISGVTKSTTFEGKGQFVSDTEIKGALETMVHYGDFNLAVPNLPFLANVDQDVKLLFEFVAKK
ncbi:YceI family protein [Patescibacteria group bacterium]|jgi:polyisoprenoid-binding protein YceI|nr:YceI family protein [Patescibacteria group bacterium]